jgi:hypothetical protein
MGRKVAGQIPARGEPRNFDQFRLFRSRHGEERMREERRNALFVNHLSRLSLLRLFVPAPPFLRFFPSFSLSFIPLRTHPFPFTPSVVPCTPPTWTQERICRPALHLFANLRVRRSERFLALALRIPTTVENLPLPLSDPARSRRKSCGGGESDQRPAGDVLRVPATLRPPIPRWPGAWRSVRRRRCAGGSVDGVGRVLTSGDGGGRFATTSSSASTTTGKRPSS